MNVERIGILGGTFDPVHFGHLAIAEEARAALQLELVLFVPALHQPLKPAAPLATGAQRLAMLELACAGNGAFEPSPIELARPAPSFTVTTLKHLAASTGAELFLIVGADALARLPDWRAAARILELARIVAVGRPDSRPEVARLERSLPALARRLTLLEGPGSTLSSSDLRRRVAAGRPIRYLTPDPVVEYIERNGLYR